MVSVPVNRSPARQRMLQLVELARMPELTGDSDRAEPALRLESFEDHLIGEARREVGLRHVAHRPC